MTGMKPQITRKSGCSFHEAENHTGKSLSWPYTGLWFAEARQRYKGALTTEDGKIGWTEHVYGEIWIVLLTKEWQNTTLKNDGFIVED